MPRVETHSLAALLTFCLPVGLITYWVFQLVIKSPILEVLPDGPHARWRPFAAEADFRSCGNGFWRASACWGEP